MQFLRENTCHPFWTLLWLCYRSRSCFVKVSASANCKINFFEKYSDSMQCLMRCTELCCIVLLPKKHELQKEHFNLIYNYFEPQNLLPLHWLDSTDEHKNQMKFNKFVKNSSPKWLFKEVYDFALCFHLKFTDPACRRLTLQFV